MGMPFPKLPMHLFDPELQPFIDRLNAWGRDTDRRQKSMETRADKVAPMQTLSLNSDAFVQATRIVGGVSAFSVSGITGNLLPATDDTFDVGQNTTPLRWRDLWLSRNADINGTLDVLSGVTITGRASIGGISTTSGSSLGAATFYGDLAGTTIQSVFFQTGAGPTGIISLTAGYSDGLDGVIIGVRGVTSNGPADFLAPVHAISRLAVDGALGVTGLATFAGGVSSATGFTITGAVATIQNLTVTGGLTGSFATLSNNLRVDGALGVTGQASLTGGLQASSGVTVTSGTVSLPTAAGSGITGSIFPTVNLAGQLGGAARRWGQIFGGTLTLTNSATVGGTLTVSKTLTAGATLSVSGNAEIQGALLTGAGFNSDTFPETDNLYGFGSPNLRWNRMYLSGMNVEAMGATITAGTTIVVNWATGNYAHINGISSIAGISTGAGVGAALQAGARILFNLNNNPIFLHSSRLILSGATDWTGTTGAMIEFVSEGADNWREVIPRGRT